MTQRSLRDVTSPHDHRLFARRFVSRIRLGVHVVRDLGLPMLTQVFVNSLHSKRAARTQGRGGSTSVQGLGPGILERLEPQLGGARFFFSRAELEVTFLTHDVVRFSWGPGDEPVPYALVDELEWPVPQIALVDRSPDGWEMFSDAVQIGVSANGELEINSREAKLLRRCAPPLRRGGAWEHRFEMRPGERFSGLGEQTGGVDLRGGSFDLWNTDVGGAWGPGSGPMYESIPVLLCTHRDGNLLEFFENPTRSTFSFGALPASATLVGSPASATFAGGRLRWYAIRGAVPHLYERLSELTGRPSMPPRWALGYHQSRWGYKDERDVHAVVEGYSMRSLPLSAVHLDIDYMDGYRVFTFDRRRFPDPSRLSAEVARRGVRLVTIVDPGVKVDQRYRLYGEGEASGLFCLDASGRTATGVVWPGRAAFPDFTDARVRSWWAEQYSVLVEAGVAGAWHDMNEPASITFAGDPTLPLDTRHHLDGRGGDHREAHNLYGLLMNRSGFEGLRAARPDARPFVVSRSGWASNQRWAWNWTGDANSTWAAMRQQVATITGLGLSGIPFAGSDIGGFSGVPEDELYLRWLQMSVFMGFCRTHSRTGVPPREPWRFEEPWRSRVGAWIRFRYRLLPYLYTLARAATETGAPLVRPPWWPFPGSEIGGKGRGRDEPDDREEEMLGRADDEFLLGDALLVAPVYEPGAKRREVTVPRGTWNLLWEEDPGVGLGLWPLEIERVTKVSLPAPVDRPPVLVRSGMVLPLDDGFAQSIGPCTLNGDRQGDGYTARSGSSGPVSLDHAPRLLSFHCWPDRRGRAQGTCVDDSGDGYGPVRRDVLTLTGARDGASASLTWQRSGGFAAPANIRVVLHGYESPRVMSDGVSLGGTEAGAIESPVFDRLDLTELRARPRGS